MRGTRLFRLLTFGLFFLLPLAVFAAMFSYTQPDRSAPTAVRGVLDLTSWELDNQSFIALDGEWEYYEGVLLEPEQLQAERERKAQTVYASVPDVRDGYGNATYRLTIKLPPGGQQYYSLKLSNIRTAHSLYLNGKREGGSGVPALQEENSIPSNIPYVTVVRPDGDELEIVLTLSNYIFPNQGIINSIVFGTYTAINTMDSLQIGSEVALLLMMFIFGTYHLSHYYFSRRERLYLLSGLYLISQTAAIVLYGEKLFQRLLPGLPFELTYKLLDLASFSTSLLLLELLCSVEPRLFSKKARIVLVFPALVYIGFVLTLPYKVHIQYKAPFMYYLLVFVVVLIVRLLVTLLKDGRQETRLELLVFMLASAGLMVNLVVTSLHAQNWISSNVWGRVGLVGFILCLNAFLALRFARAYERTAQLTRQLTAANELKDEFLMHTSHEMKTPLHGIINMTSHLLEDREGTLSDKQKKQLWLVHDTSSKLSMLIHDLLDVTRLKYGELRLSPSVVDVRVAVQIVMDMLQFELAGKPIVLDNRIRSAMYALADENRLRQVLYNLIHNSIRHTEQGRIQVIARTDGSMLQITVEDTGRGIPANRHESIFEEFVQLELPQDKDSYSGMGVGLYISRRLIEQMGGKIWVDWSMPGQGTRISCSLPTAALVSGAQEAAAASSLAQRLRREEEPLDQLQEYPHTILLVDDERSNIQLLLYLLREEPYNVLTAFSAREALDKMHEHGAVDLVLLDVMMPGISGLELCRLLREKHSILDLPILFATVKDAPRDIALGFEAGANDYVTKPFEANTLLARIHTLISMRSSIQEAIRNELAFHQAQIKPHFLYNALSSVISFCYTDGERAAHLLSMLSQYLRYILELDRSELYAPLSRELELIHAYVEIEKARFGDRFTFQCETGEGLASALVPSLSIQPFVENAIRHGLFEMEEGGEVLLRIHPAGNCLRITVQDNGIGIPDEQLYRLLNEEDENRGIGITNIRKRLRMIPGATLNMDSEIGQGTKITMFIPLELM